MADNAGVSESGDSSPTPTLGAKLVKRLLQLHWDRDDRSEGAKINPDGLLMTGELLRKFVVEAQKRAQFEAEMDNDEVVTAAGYQRVKKNIRIREASVEQIVPQHIERVMLGLMLDF